MKARPDPPHVNLPAALLTGAAALVVALGAGFLNHQLRTNERQRALDEARQLAFGFSREATEQFWRFREEFIFSLTHLPYERLLLEEHAAPETLVPVRRFLSLNQNILRELVVTGPDNLKRTMRIKGENYVLFSPLEQRPADATGAKAAPVAISGVVQDGDGRARATVSAELDAPRFWSERLTSFSLSHPGLWVHLLDEAARPLASRHGGRSINSPPVFQEDVLRRLAEDVREGYEGRLMHRVVQDGRAVDLVSAYAPVRIEGWKGLLLVSADEAVVLGPAATALSILAAIAAVVFLFLLALFILFTRHNLRHQRQLEESRRLAERSAREAEAANQAKSAFLAMMSHELRTPLNSILGLSESLIERIHGPLTDKQARYLDLVLRSGRHLLNLINDILDLAKIESGRLDLRLSVCSVRELCENSLQVVQPMAAKRRQKLSADLPDATLRIHADARLLHQLLVNLLGNAVKFTPDDGFLGLRVHTSPGLLHIVVWDHGIGIAAEDIPRLFQPFVQLDSRLSRDYAGTGLGLALVKQIATVHGGRVDLVSDVGAGSSFTITLPLPVETAPAAPATPETSARAPGRELAAESAPAGPSPLILIADDTPDNIVPVRDYLEKMGLRVAVAENGRLAVEQTARLRPDLVLMDIQMPELDGLEAIRRIRSLPETALARVPIFAVTALAMPSDRDRCLAAGVDDYISKPFSPRSLHEKILARLSARPPSAPAKPEPTPCKPTA